MSAPIRHGRTGRLRLAALAAATALVLVGCSSADEAVISSSSAASTTTAASVDDSTAATDATTTTDGGATAAPATGTDGSAIDTTGADAPATEPASVAPAPTTDVPAPGGGNINQTVAPVVVSTAPAVALTETASFGGGVDVKLDSLTRIETVAQGPGEISGPGLSVSITLTNNGSAAIPLDAVNVTLADAAATPGAPMTGAPASPFTGELAAGATATAVYVFALPTGYADPATVGVSYAATAPVVQFTGTTG